MLYNVIWPMMKVKLILHRQNVASILITARNHTEFECKDWKVRSLLEKQGMIFTIKYLATIDLEFLPHLFLIITQFLQNKILHKRCILTKSPSHLVGGGAAAFSQSRWIYVRKLKICIINTETWEVVYGCFFNAIWHVIAHWRRWNWCCVVITSHR